MNMLVKAALKQGKFIVQAMADHLNATMPEILDSLVADSDNKTIAYYIDRYLQANGTSLTNDVVNKESRELRHAFNEHLLANNRKLIKGLEDIISAEANFSSNATFNAALNSLVHLVDKLESIFSISALAIKSTNTDDIVDSDQAYSLKEVIDYDKLFKQVYDDDVLI
mmetsp:Transcript_22909/g.22199  ORF Transcript_22909/g.22199 Transcript_22909/m.22199 type:complete len:168 (+) Transcript_22909:1243-1746(+)